VAVSSTFTADDLLLGAERTHDVVLPAELLPAEGDPERSSHSVIVRPLVLGDVQRIYKAAGDGSVLTSALMVQQALVDPSLSLEQINRLPAGVVQYLVGEINRISGLSMGSDELSDAVHAPVVRACFVLSSHFGWTPEECANLTVGQVLLYLEMLGRDER
jgi:hypothetical protein